MRLAIVSDITGTVPRSRQFGRSCDKPESLTDFASLSPNRLQPLFATVQEISAATREALGERPARKQAMSNSNTGRVSLSYDGDCRASYLLLDGFQPMLRRVLYGVEREIKALFDSGLPHSGW